MERTSEVAAGTILAGKYRVDRVLGAGGMGVVVAAHHLHLDERVAIKMLLPEMLDHREAVERFSREARAAVKIKSEYVARVTDVGTLDNGAPYMVMEYLEGEDLSAWVAKRGPLPVEQAVEFLLQACEALAEAHSFGIVHRDIKPANLFSVRRADGLYAVKVLDFGISKTSAFGGSGDMSMTKTSAIMGSPYYMSPEQMASAKSVDAQSDIWSLGAVLFELLTGRVPFQAETLPELVIKITSSAPPNLGELRPEVPEGLRAVVQRCLERDRTRRYPNVAELAAALCEYGPPKRARASAERVSRVLQTAGISQEIPALSALAAPAATAPGMGSQTQAAFGNTTPQVRRGNARVVPALLASLGALAILGGLGVGVFVLWSDGKGDPELAGEPIPAASTVPGSAPPSANEAPPPPPPESLSSTRAEKPAEKPAPEPESEESLEPEQVAAPQKPAIPQKSTSVTKSTSAKTTTKPSTSPSSTGSSTGDASSSSKSSFGGRL